MAKLLDLFASQTGKAVDKWEQYLAIYEREIGALIADGIPRRLLEIGVQNGGSLEMWSRYLPTGSAVVGLDVDPAIANLRFDTSYITALVADATNETAVAELLGEQQFDIIIDDGSHVSSDVVHAFRINWNRLAPGGRYLIEDLHTSYWPSHGGGLRRPDSSIEYLKSLIDIVNLDHLTLDDQTAFDVEEWHWLTTWMGRVTFYDSSAVIEKLPAAKTRPYLRLLNGEQANVASHSAWAPTSPSYSLESIVAGDAALRRIDPQLREALAEREAMIAALQYELRQLRTSTSSNPSATSVA